MFIEYKLEDGSVAIVEATEDVAAFMSEEHRTTENKNRKERYYAPYSIDALIYEGMDYADTDTPETIYLGYEEEDEDERMEKYLSVLSKVQRRRVEMRLEGKTIAEIARIENKDESSVRESIESAGKRLQKKFPNIF